MIRVLVAEDEIPLLRGIKNMIEKIDDDFIVVKAASNGKEALEYIKHNDIDVIFTDINMPLIDGIELLKFLHANNPSCIKVIISGYGDFNYAKAAISLEVKEYLLKPILYEDMSRILASIKDFIIKNNKIRQENIISSVLYNGSTLKKDANIHDKKVYIAHLCMGAIMNDGYEESIEECRLWDNVDIETLALKFLSNEVSIYAFEKYNPNEKVLLLVSDNDIDMNEVSKNIVDYLVKKDIYLSVVYYPNKIDMLDIPNISLKLRKYMKDNIYFGIGKAFDYNKIENIITYSVTNNKKTIIKELKIILSNYILQKNLEEILEKVLLLLMTDNNKLAIKEMVWNLLLYSNNNGELFDNIMQILDDKGISNTNLNNKKLMELLDDYILHNYSKDINVAILARQFGLVAPYLSRLFKEYSGYTLSQYIQKIRIERAKYLLENNEDILAKDVAQIVGYTNPLYFSKIFKKKVGVYPSEYKRKLK